jgi:hypothetical protein
MEKPKLIYMPGSKFIPKTSKVGTIPPAPKGVEYLKWTNPKPGEILYEVDIKAKKIKEAEIAKIPSPLPFIKGLISPKLVVKKEGAIYIAAKNREELVLKLVERGVIKIKSKEDGI